MFGAEFIQMERIGFVLLPWSLPDRHVSLPTFGPEILFAELLQTKELRGQRRGAALVRLAMRKRTREKVDIQEVEGEPADGEDDDHNDQHGEEALLAASLADGALVRPASRVEKVPDEAVADADDDEGHDKL